MNVDLKIIGKVETLRLKPGDKIIVTVEERLTSAQGMRLREAVVEKFPDNEVVLLAGGMSLSVVES